MRGGKGLSGTGEDAASTVSRVPSFYTSRSIVNLSGLSVSDPTPLADGSSYHDNMMATVLAHQQQQQEGGGGGGTGGGGGGGMTSSRQEHQQAAATFAEVFNQSPETVGDTHEETRADVAVKEATGTQHSTGATPPTSQTHRNKSADNLPAEEKEEKGEKKQRRHSGTFEDSTQGPKVVEKTTNMANFYYRQAQSPPDKAK